MKFRKKVTVIYIYFRPLQLILIFLLVWYYCTLTIRESILKVNGSRIKGWWRLHHFISTVVAGVLLIWPQNEPWNEFRHTFMWFIAYISKYCFVFIQIYRTNNSCGRRRAACVPIMVTVPLRGTNRNELGDTATALIITH